MRDHDRDRLMRPRLALVAVLILSFSLNSIPIWWGLPSLRVNTWAFDELDPRDAGSEAQGRHKGRYAPLHYHVLRALYSQGPLLHQLGVVKQGQIQYLTLMRLLGRLLSVILATATVYIVYRCGLRLYDRATAILAAFLAALVPPFVFYAKTINLEAPYVFWFAASMLFFLRIMERHRLLDYLAFAATTTFAICTKDQAYALYGVAPLLLALGLHRHLFPGRVTPATIGRTLADRRILLASLLAILLFALIYDLPRDLAGFKYHLWVLTATDVQNAKIYEYSLGGYLALFWSAVRHLAFALGWPVFVASLAGIVLAARDRKNNWLALSLLSFPVSYYLLFLSVILYLRLRYFLPVCIVLALFAARALTALVRWQPLHPRWGWLVISGVALFSLLRPLSLDAQMLNDSRYVVEDWLRSHVGEREKVVALGYYRQFNIRSASFLDVGRLMHRCYADFRSHGGHYLVVNKEELSAMADSRFVDSLLAGGFGYDVVFRHRYRPWIGMGDRRGISTNLMTVNPEIAVLERRVQPMSDREIVAEMGRLRDGTATLDWSALAQRILDHPSFVRRRLDKRATSFALPPDAWTAATNPVAVVVENRGSRPIEPVMRLFSAPPPDTVPLTAFVQDETGIQRQEFSAEGSHRLKLTPVPARSHRLYLVYTDRLWSLAGGRYRRGVKVRMGRYIVLGSPAESAAPSSAPPARGR